MYLNIYKPRLSKSQVTQLTQPAQAINLHVQGIGSIDTPILLNRFKLFDGKLKSLSIIERQHHSVSTNFTSRQ